MTRLVDVRLVRGRDGTWRASSGDAEPQVWGVSCCAECPMARGPGVCLAAAARRLEAMHRAPPPSWCPLRSGPTVVVLEGES